MLDLNPLAGAGTFVKVPLVEDQVDAYARPQFLDYRATHSFVVYLVLRRVQRVLHAFELSQSNPFSVSVGVERGLPPRLESSSFTGVGKHVAQLEVLDPALLHLATSVGYYGLLLSLIHI